MGHRSMSAGSCVMVITWVVPGSVTITLWSNTGSPILIRLASAQHSYFGVVKTVLSANGHFCHFRRFPGLRSKIRAKSLFLWVECTIGISLIFVKTTRFRQGANDRFKKRPFGNPLIFTEGFCGCLGRVDPALASEHHPCIQSINDSLQHPVQPQ